MTNELWDFGKLNWPQVNEAVDAKRVAIIPAGTLEDHGLHLPIDTDVVIAQHLCTQLARRIPDEVVVLPPIIYGFSPHHIDGPGTITLRWDTFIESAKQIVSSLAYHGFQRVLFVNGHGSNEPVLDIASRLAIVERPDVQCGMISWWSLTEVREVVANFRESIWTGHAGELETSLYLAIDPGRVRMDLAEADINPFMSSHFWADLVSQPPEGYRGSVRMAEYWSTVSETGTWGDPRSATAAKGRKIVKAAVNELAGIVSELAERPIRRRAPHQTQEAQRRNAVNRAQHLGATSAFTFFDSAPIDGFHQRQGDSNA